MVSSSTVKDYNGVFFGPPRESIVIRAKTVETAKAQMTKKYGPEKDGGKANWVCGLAPHSLTGHKLT